MANTETKKIRRPTTYSQEIAERLCLRLASSSDGLRRICREDRTLPERRVVLRWLVENEDFRTQYARARDLQYQSLGDEMIELADHVRIGKFTRIRADGKKEVRSGDMVERARLQIETRKWLLAKLLPKKYGDRIEIDQDSDPLLELIASMRQESKRLGPPPQDDEGIVDEGIHAEESEQQ